ncbi:MAG: 3'(2'),5'-bisphosphate nucleotidase CysQ family protein [Spirochaetota bacterium]
MKTPEQMVRLLPKLLSLAVRAGAEILAVYESDDFETERKADDSPLTLADRRSHDVLDAGLRALAPEIPILSEEGRSIPYDERKHWDELWLVDPLDGTKEFIKRNGEFTVNIALVRHGEPVLGVIYAPDRHEAWVGVARSGRPADSDSDSGSPGFGAWKLAGAALDPFAGAEPHRSESAAGRAPLPQIPEMGRPISVRARDERRVSIIASRTHLNPETEAFIDRASDGFKDVDIVNVGSSLKLCYVAEGRADLYPRYAPTSEWDTAAGHAIVRAAGGEIYQAEPDAEGSGNDRKRTDRPLRYNKENVLNPWFVVRAW